MKKMMSRFTAVILSLCLVVSLGVTAFGAVVAAEEAETKELTGKVTVYMPSPAGLTDNLKEGFEAATGVSVEVFQGTTGEILARLEAEKANPIADVVVLASWSDGLKMKEEGSIQAYEAEGKDLMNEGFVDEDNMLYGTSASAVGVIYNTTIYPELDADWSELSSEEYQDDLVFPDPEKSGAAKDFLSGYITTNGEESWKVWEDMAAIGMTIPGANKAALEAVTTGEKGILIAGVDYNAFSSHDKGEPINIYYPEGGTVVNPRPAMIMKDAPNVENAQAFMDYLLSDEAQQMVVDAYLLPGRSDIEVTNRIALEDINQIEVDWEKVVAESNDIAAKMNEITQ